MQVTADSTDAPVTAAVLAHYGFSSVLCIPLRRGGETIGVQAAGCRTRTTPLTPAQERIARGIAQLASMALTNAQLFEELTRASQLKSEFLSTMSHELRTPLNVILGYLEMLTDDPMPEGRDLLLSRARRSTLELLERIEATLDLSRIAAGKDSPTFETVPLAELWDELGAEFAALTRTRDIALRWEAAADVELRTDRRKLKTILKNLVGNALKFTSEGEVVVRGQRSKDGWVFSVRDTGIGIPPEQLPHVFEMFRQVDGSDARSYGGTGLGLYIVHQLTEQLGGVIEVESEPGRGSLFRVTLPFTPLAGDPQVAA